MSEDNTTVFFLLNVAPNIIHCKKSDKLDDIVKKFAEEISGDKENYEYFYGSTIIEDFNKEISDLTKDAKDKNNLIITVKKKESKRIVKIIKCPLCECNDCILNIEKYHLFFSGCKYGHTVDMILDRYKESQNIDFSKIECSGGCGKTQINKPKDFNRCLTCQEINKHSIYICDNCSKEHENTHVKVAFDERNCYCEKNNHFSKINKYCEKCENDLCDKCLEEHNKDKDKEHVIKEYSSLDLEIDDLQKEIDEIKGKINTVRIIASGIKSSIEGAYQLFQNYGQIAQDIANKYNYNKNYKNYKILKSIQNLKRSNQKIKKDLDDIINNKSVSERFNKLIKIFLEDRRKYGNIGASESKRSSVEILLSDDVTVNSGKSNTKNAS
jgi:hypothetical protein